MVLWEITLGTAYFLGLRRTYRLALKIQRLLISPKHPKIRQFGHSYQGSQSIQKRDIEVGRHLGNRILRWLDRMKPEAQIRGPSEKPPTSSSSSMSMTKQVSSSRFQAPRSSQTSKNKESDRHLFSTMTNIWSKPLLQITMMMTSQKPSGMIASQKPSGMMTSQKPSGMMTYYRHISMNAPQGLRSNYSTGWFGEVIRKDIM